MHGLILFQIKESQFHVDSWRTKGLIEMQLSYPPRVRMTATAIDNKQPIAVTFSIKFEGCSNADELNFQVILPLRLSTCMHFVY